ncbi:PAS domain-containing protein [Paraburkholderia sprentiae]|nr:PAS domain-containing protein [Paraburkholderia sprentiae]
MTNQTQTIGETSGEQSFQLLIAGVREYAIFMLDPEGFIKTWNAGAQRFKGYAASEIIGRHFSVFYTEHDRTSGRPALALRTALDEGKFEDDGWRVRKDGSQFWASVVIDPLRDDSGKPIGFAKIAFHQLSTRVPTCYFP